MRENGISIRQRKEAKFPSEKCHKNKFSVNKKGKSHGCFMFRFEFIITQVKSVSKASVA
jgi:hypothetical protein